MSRDRKFADAPPKSARPTDPAEQWISLAEFSRRTGLSPHHVKNYAIAGEIATRVRLGSPPRYRAEDADKLRGM